MRINVGIHFTNTIFPPIDPVILDILFKFIFVHVPIFLFVIWKIQFLLTLLFYGGIRNKRSISSAAIGFPFGLLFPM